MLKPAVKRKPTPTGSGQLWPDAHNWLVNGRVTPFISNYMATDLFQVEADHLVAAWAAEIESPLGEAKNRDLVAVAQFYSVKLKSRLAAKSHYLATLTNYLLGMAAGDEASDPEQVAELTTAFAQQEQFPHPFSDLVRQLGYPRYGAITDNPLRLLAEIDLPLYITTSHHEFIEMALTDTGRKQPVTEFFYWHEGLHGISSIYDREPDYEPSPQRPLVYHLHGVDRHPESLILSEDDHLDLLVKLAEAPYRVKLSEKNVRDIPARVRMALSGTALLMLGYDIYSWEFRVLLRGLIKATGESRNNRNIPKGVCVQIDPQQPGPGHAAPAAVGPPADPTQARMDLRDYLRQYFDEIHFNVYWGSIERCVQELYQTYKGGHG